MTACTGAAESLLPTQAGLPLDVRDWLQSLGLGSHAPAFEREEVDLQAVQLLSEDDLSFLGVAHSAHRRVLLLAAARLAQEQRLLQPPHEQRQAAVQARESCQLQQGGRGSGTTGSQAKKATTGHAHVEHARPGQVLQPCTASGHGHQLQQAGRKRERGSACREPLERVPRGSGKPRTGAVSSYSRQAELRLLGALYPPPAGSSLREAVLSPGGFVCGQQGLLTGCSEPQQPQQGTAAAGHMATEDNARHRPSAAACQTLSAPVMSLQGASRGHQCQENGGSSMASAPDKGSPWALARSTDASACPLPGLWKHYTGRKAAAAAAAATVMVHTDDRNAPGRVASTPGGLDASCTEDGMSCLSSEVPPLLKSMGRGDACDDASRRSSALRAQAPLTERQKLAAERVAALKEELHAAEEVVAHLKQWLSDAEREHDHAMATRY